MMCFFNLLAVVSCSPILLPLMLRSIDFEAIISDHATQTTTLDYAIWWYLMAQDETKRNT